MWHADNSKTIDAIEKNKGLSIDIDEPAANKEKLSNFN